MYGFAIIIWIVWRQDMALPDLLEVKRIVDALYEAESHIAKLRAEYAALFAGCEIDEDGGKGGTIGERILGLLSANPSITFSAPRVALELGAKQTSVGPNLSRLVAEGKIRKVGHGEYKALHPALSSWTPSMLEGDGTEKDPEALTN
jgi:hypothetical protein